MKLAFLIIPLTTISITGCTVDSTQEKNISEGPFDLYGSAHEITLHSKTKLQGKGANALFNKFKQGGENGGGYYGAFAYSFSGGARASHTGYDTLKAAREGALAGCRSFRKKRRSTLRNYCGFDSKRIRE